MACVYKHIRLDSDEVFYIGIGDLIKRAYSKKNRTKYWHNIVNGVGYKVEIVFDELSWENAVKWEIYLIDIYGRKDLKKGHLINLTDGGDGVKGLKHSKDSKIKMREKKVGLYKGIPRPPETVEKMKRAAIGRNPVHLQSTKKFKDCRHTEESKQKIRSYSGEKSWNFGKKQTQEHIDKIQATRRKNGVNIKPITDEHRKIISETQKQKDTCPHCGLFGNKRALKRWHFDNCRKIN